jgi:hypothetical protein
MTVNLKSFIYRTYNILLKPKGGEVQMSQHLVRLKAFIGRLQDEHGQAFMGIIMMAGGLLALVAIFSIAPLVGYSIDAAINVPVESEWANASLPTGLSLWSTNAPLLSLVITVSILVTVIGAIMTFSRVGQRNY